MEETVHCLAPPTLGRFFFSLFLCPPFISSTDGFFAVRFEPRPRFQACRSFPSLGWFFFFFPPTDPVQASFSFFRWSPPLGGTAPVFPKGPHRVVVAGDYNSSVSPNRFSTFPFQSTNPPSLCGSRTPLSLGPAPVTTIGAARSTRHLPCPSFLAPSSPCAPPSPSFFLFCTSFSQSMENLTVSQHRAC